MTEPEHIVPLVPVTAGPAPDGGSAPAPTPAPRRPSRLVRVGIVTGTAALVLVGLGMVIGGLGLLRPPIIRPLFTGLIVITLPIGWMISRILLAVLFYGVFTPVGALFRLIGRDALSVKPRGDRTTYWLAKPSAPDLRSYFRQS